MYQVTPVFCSTRPCSFSPISKVQAQTPEKKFTSLRLTTSTFWAAIPLAIRSGLQAPVESLVLWMFHCIRRSVLLVVGAGAGAGAGAGVTVVEVVEDPP